jgi:hypothetical protein
MIRATDKIWKIHIIETSYDFIPYPFLFSVPFFLLVLLRAEGHGFSGLPVQITLHHLVRTILPLLFKLLIRSKDFFEPWTSRVP